MSKLVEEQHNRCTGEKQNKPRPATQAGCGASNRIGAVFKNQCPRRGYVEWQSCWCCRVRLAKAIWGDGVECDVVVIVRKMKSKFAAQLRFFVSCPWLTSKMKMGENDVRQEDGPI